MTVHVISMGLSVLRALKDPRRELQSDASLREAVAVAAPHKLLADAGIGHLASDRARASEWIAAALADADSAAGKKLRDTAEAIRPQDWPLRVSAELDTFSRLSRRRSFVLGRGDIAVLVCSDTTDGLLAGVWNAIAFADGDIGRVRYVPDLDVPFSAELKKSLRGNVVIARVVGLDAGDEGFRSAMRGLGLLARRLFASGVLERHRDEDEDFQFILSGGFKASIPYLIGLAETIRSVDDQCLRELGVPELVPAPEPYPVTAWVQHETADPEAPPIGLPLRRFVAEAARQEVSGYDERGIRAEPLGVTLLEGYAYDVKKKREYRLTPFGEGLRAFLGTTHARPGG